MAGGGFNGHWEGNVSTARYDVFPQGAYSVGDQWFAVDSQFDAGGSSVRCQETGFGYGGCLLGCCPGGGDPFLGCFRCSVTLPDGVEYCNVQGLQPFKGWYFESRACGLGCESNFYKLCYNPDWKTRYNVYEYRPAEWQELNGIEFDPANPMHGWVFRYQSVVDGLVYS